MASTPTCEPARGLSGPSEHQGYGPHLKGQSWIYS